MDMIRIIENECNLSDEKIIVLQKEGWHQGVIGIVASRIKDKHNKPTILISLNGIFFSMKTVMEFHN